MSSESESSFCSTCSGSHNDNESNGSDSHSYDTTLDDNDLQYINHFNTHLNEDLFYLQLLDKNEGLIESEIEKQTTDEKKNELSTLSNSKLNTNDRLRSSYTRLTSWVFDTKRFGTKKKSFKRKTTKKSIKSKKSGEKSGTNTQMTPSISVSVCDETNNDLNDNKLFNFIIDGNRSTIVSTNEHQMVLMYLMAPNDTTDRDCLVFSHPKYESEDSKNSILLKLK